MVKVYTVCVYILPAPYYIINPRRCVEIGHDAVGFLIWSVAVVTTSSPLLLGRSCNFRFVI